MVWTSGIGLTSNSAKQRFFILFLMLGFFSSFSPSASAEIINSISSTTLSSTDLLWIQKRLGLSVGTELRVRQLDEAIKKLVNEGKVQTLFVDVKTSKLGIELVIRAALVKKLEILKLNGLESGIWTEVQKGLPPFEEGNEINPAVFTKLKAKIRAALEERGYYSPEVDIKISEAAVGDAVSVEVSVQKGVETLVSEVVVKGGAPFENEEIKEELPLRKGDRFTRGVLDEALVVINKYLKRNRYPSGKIDETSIDFSLDKKTVDINFVIKTGERYQFLFLGNRIFNEAVIREWLSSELVEQSDAPQKIAELLESKYREVGFHYVHCEFKQSERKAEKLKLVEFRIDEGPKVLLDRVRFNGNVGLAMDTMESELFKTAPGVLIRSVYWERGLVEWSSNFQKRLRSLGFLNASVPLPRTVMSADKKGAELIFDVEMGEQSFIAKIEFYGVNETRITAAKALLNLQVGDPVNEALVEENRKKILELIIQEGFNDAKYSDTPAFRLSDNNKAATLIFSVIEGSQYFVGRVETEGNHRTQSHVILREMLLKRGDKFNPELLRQSEDEISLLGIFSRVEMVASKNAEKSNEKDIKVLVSELKPGSGEFGLGGVFEDPRFRLRGFFGVAYKNLFGLNQTVSARSEVAVPLSHKVKLVPFIEYSAVLGYRAPYLFKFPFTFVAQTSLDNFEVATNRDASISNLQTRARIEEKIEKKLSSHLSLIYRLHRFERSTTETLILLAPDDINNPSNPSSPNFNPTIASKERVDIGSTGPVFSLDYRDDVFNPTRGSYHNLDIEFAHPVLLSQERIGFLMTIFRNSFYLPLIDPVGLAFFAGAGYGASLYSDSSIPKARLFTDLSLGGQGSIRGFSPKIFKPQEDSTHAGYYNARVELTTLLFYEVSGAIFIDIGQVFSRGIGRRWESHPRHQGVGVGFRYKTPVGPVVIDISEGLGEDKEPVKFNFTIGIF